MSSHLDGAVRDYSVESSHVNVLRAGVHDLGRTEWSHRCCIGSTLRRISIFVTSRGHLTLAVTSRGFAMWHKSFKLFGQPLGL